MKYLLASTSLIFAFVFNSFSQKKDWTSNANDRSVKTSDGVSLYLKVAGKGVPCIVIHGGPGAWSRSFEEMGGNVLEKYFTMYYYDQRGSGRSTSAPDNNYSPERMVEDIEHIRSLSGQDKVYIIAHSFGGILAYKYAEKYPKHVKGLILLNVTLNIRHSLLAQIAFINQLLGSSITVKDNDSLMPSFIAAKTRLREKQLEYKMLSDNKATVEKLDSMDNAIVRNYSFARKALEMPEYFMDFTPGTANVNIPVLVITGTADHNIGPDHYTSFKFPNQQVRVIEGGHVLYYEKNKEFEKAVSGFIK